MDKKTYKRDQFVSVVFKYLLQLLSVAGFYFVLFYTITSFWIHQLLDKFTKVPYISTPNFHDQIIHLLIIYTLFCYFANAFVLDLYHSERTKSLLYSILADLLIIPLGMLIMIIYNSVTLKFQPALDTSIYNIYLITALIVAKELIAGRILARKNTSGKRTSYKTR